LSTLASVPIISLISKAVIIHYTSSHCK